MLLIFSGSVGLFPICSPAARTLLSRSISWKNAREIEQLHVKMNCSIFLPFVAREFSKLIPHALESESSLSQKGYGVWEDPDVGCGSEWEEMAGKLEENDLDYESDWDEDSDGVESSVPFGSFISNSSEEKLIEEVEQLLTPEEKLILQLNPHPNVGKISSPKWMPLHTLALSGQIAFFDKLLDEGLHIDTLDMDGQTPLHKAIMGKKEVAINHLVRNRANLEIRDRDGATPLHYAVHVGSMETVKLLIKYGVDVNVSDNEGWTPLHVSVQRRNRDIVKILLVNGADKTLRNMDGRTALDICLCYGRDLNSYDIAKLLKLVPADKD